MPLQQLPTYPNRYTDLEGNELNLAELEPETRAELAELIQYFNSNPPYPQFKTFWRDDESPVSVYLAPGHPLNRLIRNIGRDLEKRLGLAQGRLSSP